MILVMKLLNIFKGSLLFLFSKYFIFGIQFLNSILIAVYLGPFYLGVWGFITMIFQYFEQLNFGVPHGVSVALALNKERHGYLQSVIGNSLIQSIAISILVGIGFSILVYYFNFGSSYYVSEYFIVILLIACLTNIINVLSNICRIYNQFYILIIIQSLLPVSILVVSFFFKREFLLSALLYSQLTTTIISVLLLFMTIPIKVKYNLSWKLFNKLRKVAIPLFFYNASFYLIMISTRSFISTYNVKEFGLFTFSFSLGNALFLLLDSVSFLIWPKLLRSMNKHSDDGALEKLKDYRILYQTATHIIMYISLLLYPLLIVYFEKYSATQNSFTMVVLTLVMLSNAFGYQGLMVAKGKQKKLALVALFCLLLNTVICYFLVFIIRTNYYGVLFGTMIAYMVFSVLLVKQGISILNIGKGKLINNLSLYITPSMLLPYFLTCASVITGRPSWVILSFVIFLIFNYKNCLYLFKTIIEIIKDPKILEF